MLKLSKLFGNHAVLQRNRAIPVWGWTEPFEIVEGSLGGVPAVARAGDDGRFVFRFPPVVTFCFLKADQLLKCIPNAIVCNRYRWVRTLTRDDEAPAR